MACGAGDKDHRRIAAPGECPASRNGNRNLAVCGGAVRLDARAIREGHRADRLRARARAEAVHEERCAIQIDRRAIEPTVVVPRGRIVFKAQRGTRVQDDGVIVRGGTCIDEAAVRIFRAEDAEGIHLAAAERRIRRAGIKAHFTAAGDGQAAAEVVVVIQEQDAGAICRQRAGDDFVCAGEHIARHRRRSEGQD